MKYFASFLNLSKSIGWLERVHANMLHKNIPRYCHTANCAASQRITMQIPIEEAFCRSVSTVVIAAPRAAGSQKGHAISGAELEPR